MDMQMKITRPANLLWLLTLLSIGFCEVTTADSMSLMQQHGDHDKHFEEIDIGHMRVYYHQRMIGTAIVEKDYIVYQLDGVTKDLLARKSHWRKDLPDVLPELSISQEQAEAMVTGEILFVDLIIISPDSDVFPVGSTTDNPCWVVRSINKQGDYIVTIIDAITEEHLGRGVPPPSAAFSLTGPWYFNPCSGSWYAWSEHAQWWFNEMGYPTEEIEWPTEAMIQSHVQSNEIKLFYELAHGGSTSFASGCLDGSNAEYTYAYEIEAWIAGYEKKPFTFIGSCGGMCSTGPGTFAYEFRKGSNINSTVVGYCGMAEQQCATCWTLSIDWQDALFSYMSLGYTVKDAFEQANADYPACASGNCMRFAGDENYVLDLLTCPADLTGDDQVNIDDIFAALGLWGDCDDPCPPYCAGDMTKDCTVNIDDIFSILGQWGPCE